MKLYIGPSRVVMIKHGNDEPLEFEGIGSQNKHYPENELFKEINKFWSTLPEKEQLEIYDLYSAILNHLLDSRPEVVLDKICPLIGRLVDHHHNFHRIAEFAKTVHIDYPSNADVEYNSNDNRKKRVLTYTKSEYFDLVVISIIVRTMLPIWLLYRETQDHVSENRIFVDLEILRTITHTEFFDSEAMHRLFDYVYAVYEKNDRNKELGSIANGLCSEDIPIYLYSTAIVNKLAIRPVNTKQDNGNLISTVHEKVSGDGGKIGERFQALMERSENRGSDGEEDKTGYLESFSVREKVATDIFKVNQVYLSEYRKVRRHLDEDIPLPLVKACIDSIAKNPPRPFLKHHVALVQWVLNRSMNPQKLNTFLRECMNEQMDGIMEPESRHRRRLVMARTVPNIDRPEMINAMGLTAAALIHWRFRDIAKFMFSSEDQLTEDEKVAGIDTPVAQLRKGLREELLDVYPYVRVMRDANLRSLTAGVKSVDAFTDLVVDTRWNLKCSKAVEKELQSEGGPFIVDVELRNRIAELLIKINKPSK